MMVWNCRYLDMGGNYFTSDKNKLKKKNKTLKMLLLSTLRNHYFFYTNYLFFRKQASRTVCVDSTVLIAFHLKGKWMSTSSPFCHKITFKGSRKCLEGFLLKKKKSKFVSKLRLKIKLTVWEQHMTPSPPAEKWPICVSFKLLISEFSR